MRVILRFCQQEWVALTATFVAASLSVACWPWTDRLPFLLFTAAVVICTFTSGPRSGLISTGLSTALLLLFGWLWLPSDAGEAASDHRVRLLLFVPIGVLATYLCVQCRRATLAFERVHATLTHVGQGLMFADLDGKLTYLNPVAQKITGFTDEDARGQLLSQVLPLAHEGTDQLLPLDVDTVVKQGTSTRFPTDAVLRTRGGGERAVEGTLAPLRASDGRTVGSVVTLQEVSQERRADRQARQNQERVLALSAAAPVGLLYLDAEGRCFQVNERFQRLCGCTAEESFGQGWVRILHPRDHDRFFAEWSAATHAGQPYVSEWRVQSSQKEDRWLGLCLTTVSGTPGGVLGFIGTVEDITRRKQAEQQLSDTVAVVESLQVANREAATAHQMAEQQWRAESSGLAQKLAELTAVHERATKETQDTRQKLERQLAEMTQKYQQASDAWQREKEAWEQRLAALQTEHAGKLEPLQKIQETLQQQLTQRHEEHRRAAEAWQAEREELERRLATSTAASVSVEDRIREAQAELASKLEQQRLAQQQSEESWSQLCEDLQRQLDAAKAAQQQAELALRQLEAQSHDHRVNLQNAHEQAAADWHQTRTALEQQAAEERAARARTEEALRAEHAALTQELERLRTAHTEIHETRNQERIESESRIRTLEEELAEARLSLPRPTNGSANGSATPLAAPSHESGDWLSFN